MLVTFRCGRTHIVLQVVDKVLCAIQVLVQVVLTFYSLSDSNCETNRDESDC